MEQTSLSATDEGEASTPSISTYGGELIAENAEFEHLSLATQSVVNWDGTGTEQDPYQISDVDHLVDAYNKINNISSSDKYFILTDNIDISSLSSINDFHDSALSSAAYLLSAEGSNPSSVYFKIDGDGYKIYSSTSTEINASGYQYFALFGFMNEYCSVENLVIENINVALTNAAAGSIVAFKNEGTINNVTVTNCAMSISGSTANIDQNSTGEDFSYLDNNSNTGNDIYPGFAAVAADNRGVVRDSSVEDFRVTVNNGSHYIGGLVGQNRGTVGAVLLSSDPATYSVGCVVSGLKITATAANANIGGAVACNAAGHTVRKVEVDLAGNSNFTNNIYGGRCVGGLIGWNDGSLIDSLVEGSFSTISSPSADSYDMCGVVRSDNNANAVPYYYGGAVAGGSGSVSLVTVQNLGFYMSLVSEDQPCYFGGIIATASEEDAVIGCVSTGSFVSSAYNPSCYAGGIIAYAPSTAEDDTLSDCYTLFRLQNQQHYLNGAVIGFGGTETMASNCYWSSEISGCATAYAIPNASDSSIIEKVSNRSLDLNSSVRATVARRNVTLTGVDKPTHTWGGGASFAAGGTISDHTVQGTVNSLNAAPYQQTLTLPSGVGYSGRTSFAVDFKLDVFITASDNVGDPNDPSNPFQISSSGMIRFLYLAPYGNYVLTQDVTIDEYEWEPVAFYGRLSGTYNGVPHAIYAPRRVFSAVIGYRAAGVDVTNAAYDPATVSANGGLIEQLSVILTPDYFVLETGAFNESVFGSLFGATLRSVALENDTAEIVKLSGTRQGVLADAAYSNTYIFGCSTDVSLECSGSGTDMGAFIGYLDNSGNVVDNCVIDADVTLASGSSAANAAAFIGNISDNGGMVLNSIVVTTVGAGVSSVFGTAGTGATAAARGFDNIYWSRNAYDETSMPIDDGRLTFEGLELWGTSNDQTLGQYYVCDHTLNSGDAVVQLPLPQNIAKVSVSTAAEVESEFSITRITGDNVRRYNDPRRSLDGNNLVLSFTATSQASNSSVELFKVVHTKTGLCAYIQITSLTADGFEVDEDGYLMIRSAADLYNISNEIHSGSPEGQDLSREAFKLYANIDMSYFDGTETNREFYAIGTVNTPFQGTFVGQTDQNGNNLYAISNVTLLAANDNNMMNYNGLFGVVDSTDYNDENRGIEDFDIVNIRVIGGDVAGGLIGSIYCDTFSGGVFDVPVFPISGINVIDSVITGGDQDGQTSGRRVGGLIGEAASNSIAVSNVTLDNVEVTTFFYDSAFSNKIASTSQGENNAYVGYFTPDYFSSPSGIGGVIGVAYSEQSVDYPNELTITDTHVSDLYIAGKSYLDETETVYATMDAGGIVGAVLDTYDPNNPETILTSLTIGSSAISADVTVTDSKILAYGNAGGIIGASNVATALTNCVVRGSNNNTAPNKSEMQILSQSLFYLGGIAGYSGISTYNVSDGSALMSSNAVYASITDCLVENAYVASTETSSMGVGNAPMRSVAVGGIIGGGNGQGYKGWYWDFSDPENPEQVAYDSATQEEDSLLPFVNGCTVNHSRIEGIITGGIVGADAEVQYSFDNGYLPNCRDLIEYCTVTNSQITTVADVTRLPADCTPNPNNPEAWDDPVLNEDVILASGVGGIMGTNVRFFYSSLSMDSQKSISDYSYLHDTIIQYCTVSANTTVESLLPFIEKKTFCTVAVGGVIGNAFTNTVENVYDEKGRCMLRYNEVNASIYNSANLSDSQDLTEWINTSGEMEVKVATGGFIGAVKGGMNQYQSALESSYSALCYVAGIHVYTSVFSGKLSGVRAMGGAIGVVNFASDYDENNHRPASWNLADVENGEVPNHMLYNLALAGSITLAGSSESYLSGSCCGGYVIGHISGGSGAAYTFEDGLSNFFTSPDQVFSDITYTSFGSDPYLVPFGFLNGDPSVNSAPRIDGVTGSYDCCRDVNLDENTGEPRFKDQVKSSFQRYTESYSIAITEGNGDSFVIMAADLPQYNWRGSDDSVAEVISTREPVNEPVKTAKSVKVHGLKSGTILVSIPFVGVLSDGTGSGAWSSKEVFIPCGFKYETPVEAPLTTATLCQVDGNGNVVLDENDQPVYQLDDDNNVIEYHLIRTPYDMSSIGYTFGLPQAQSFYPNKSQSPSVAAMGWKYALYNETGVLEFTDDMFASDGSYPGGLDPVGKSNYPFTGSFETLPEGTYIFTTQEVVYSGQYPTFSTASTETVTVDYDALGYERMTLRNVKVKTEATQQGDIGASLFGIVSGAEFRNFNIDGMELTGTTAGNYLGAISCKVFAPASANTAPITIEYVNVNNFDFSSADYIGGLVGGIFANQTDSSVNTAASVISHCVVGAPDMTSVKASSYVNSMKANLGVGGLIAHSSQYATNISDCVVRDVDIEQEADSFDKSNLDNGAAGVAMAYAGTMQRVTVEHCAITGEIVGGAVMRSYTSQLEDYFASAGRFGNYSGGSCYAASLVVIDSVSVQGCTLVGTNDADSNDVGSAPFSASGGILARVDANTSKHYISNCLVDKKTTITSVNGLGGIVGCLEAPASVTATTRSAQFGVTVTDCTMNAKLYTDMTDRSEGYNRGVGGVIGVFYQYSPLTFTQISGCTVAGEIHSHTAAGGLVGAMYAISRTNNYFTRGGDASTRCTSYLDFANMPANTHFASNCLITTSFIKKDTSDHDVSVFTDSSLGVGVVLGYYLLDSDDGLPIPVSDSVNYAANHNEPFFNIMFSTANYSEGHVALFGFDNAESHGACMNGVENATMYCYDLNRTTADPDNESSHFTIDSSEGYLDLPDVSGKVTRINKASENTDETTHVTTLLNGGMPEVDSRFFNSSNSNTISFGWAAASVENISQDMRLLFDTATPGEEYSFNAAALPHAFTASSQANVAGGFSRDNASPANIIAVTQAGETTGAVTTTTKNHEPELTAVELVNGTQFFEVNYPAGKTATNPGNAQAFTLTLKPGQELNDKLTLTLNFVYDNGLKMSMNIFINVRAKEYWRLDPSDSGLDYTYYLVFNASDLAALQSELSTASDSRADARIIQCYDVFWTLSDSAVITAAKAALESNNTELTIQQVLGNVALSSSDTGDNRSFVLADHLGSFKRPNPEYLQDPTQDPELTFSDYYSEYYVNSPMEVPMAKVVGDIGPTVYGAYGESGRATIIDPYELGSNNAHVSVPFTGRYITLKNNLAVSTGATEHDEHYAIYGLDLRCENTIANTGSDAPYAGLFAQIGPAAKIDGIRFVNPKISVINSYGGERDNTYVPFYAGVLAGSVSGNVAISNVSVEVDETVHEGDSYVKAIARMNPAPVWAGGIAGQINGNATVVNVSVSGIDIVSSCMTNAQNIAAETSIMIGGIAGKVNSLAALQDISVSDCHVLGGHIAKPNGNIKSYGGGMFGIMSASTVGLYEGANNTLIQSEVSGTVVGGSFITNSDFSYDRTNQNNTALDIAGGVAAQSEGVSEVKYVNVIGSTIVGGDIAGGIVGQVADNAGAGLTVVFSGVGIQRVFEKRINNNNNSVSIVEDTPVEEGTAAKVLVVGTSGDDQNRFNTAGGVVGNVQNLDYLLIGKQKTASTAREDGVDFNGEVGTFDYDNHNREATAGGIIGSISGSVDFTPAHLDVYLNKIQIYGSTVQGEVRGFHRERESDISMKCAGAAGGIIGKIACEDARGTFVDQNNDGINDNTLICDCIMSANVNLYSSVYGVTVDSANNQRNRGRNTNVGKIIGRVAPGALVDEGCNPLAVVEDLWEPICDFYQAEDSSGVLEYSIDPQNGGTVYNPKAALSYALRGQLLVAGYNDQFYNEQYCAISDFIQNVYGSSYPQDIVLYGSRDLCVIDFETHADINSSYMDGVVLPYFDCNQLNRYVADTKLVDVETDPDNPSIKMVLDQAELPMQVQSFMVSEGGPNIDAINAAGGISIYASGLQSENYQDQQYTENAFIPLNADPNAPTDHYKYFRFFNPAISGSITERKLAFRSEQIDVLDMNGAAVTDASAVAEYTPRVTMSDEVIRYDLSEPSETYTVDKVVETVQYNYGVGVMTIHLPAGREMVGSLVLNFDYGIQINSSFTSIEIEGDGSENNPYLIKQPKHFIVMRALRSNGDYFKQMNNIDMNMTEDGNVLNRYTSMEGFEPIGTMASPFVGHFDGNGYVIQNLYINNESLNAAGLYGCVGKNTELKNIHIEVADSLIIRDLNDERTPVNGSIIGGNYTGGLVGIIRATGSGSVTTTVTNCSVANGNVVGGMNVGGLIGATAGTVELDNCFTSTTTASYAGVSNVGALLGAVTSVKTTLDSCYTAGYAVAGSANPSETAVGGLVGRNGDTCTLEMTDCFVSATASGNTESSIGLTVALNDGTITASGNTVAALIPREDSSKTLSIIAPDVNGAGNLYESKMLGAFSDGTAMIDYTSTTYESRVDYLTFIPEYTDHVYDGSQSGAASDAYSDAYRHLIATAVKVDQSAQGYDGNTAVNQVQTENIRANGGLLYPLTVTFTRDTVFTTSVYDLSDTVEYPMGVDLDLTGNGYNKNTDLLFKTATDGTTVIYRNIFRNNDTNNPVTVKYDGETYANGEVYYDYSLPYAVANQTVTVGGSEIAIARKIMYPVVDIEDYGVGDKIFPIATARQFKALTSENEYVSGSKFAFLREPVQGSTLSYQTRDLILVADIDLASAVFTPLASYSENFFGNGHVISNMQIDASSGSTAMFSDLQSAKVHDLGLMGVNVTNRGSDGNTKAAMLAASINRSTISNCFAIGSVKAPNAFNASASVGGLIAYAEGGGANEQSVIENCMVSGTVTGFSSNGNDASAAGLLGRSSGSVTIQNVTVTTNVSALNTYAVCGTGTNLTLLNAVFGGQMTNNSSGEGVRARQFLVPSTGVSADSLYADDGLGLLISDAGMTTTSTLIAQTFVSAANFPNDGMTSFGNGYYPAPATIDSVSSAAFRAGTRFAAAAIQLNYIASTDAVSSVTAPSNLGSFGAARLSTDDNLGAFFTNGDTDDVIKVDPSSMRLTKKVGENQYVASDEVGGITGAVSYSMLSPVSNNYLVRTVNGVKVQKIFTLYYEFTNASGVSGAVSVNDMAVITVDNEVGGNSMSTTGLTQVTSDSSSGEICDNMMIEPDNNGNCSLQAYCDTGALSDSVNSVIVRPAYMDNGTVQSNVTVSGNPNDPSVSSFSMTSADIGRAEDQGLRFSYLLVTVEMAQHDWGLQRTDGNWVYVSE